MYVELDGKKTTITAVHAATNAATKSAPLALALYKTKSFIQQERPFLQD
jgi:hypothetical protein